MARPLSLLRVEDDGQQQLLSLPPAWRQVAMLQLRPLEHICSSNNNDCSTGSTNHLQGQLLPAIAGVTAGPASVRSTLVQQQPYCGLGLGQQHAGALLQSPSQPCFGPSPFPLLDKFISSVCCVGGVQGEIRSWLVQAGSSCVVFNIKHNRWCGNVGRPHKSNGIFFCGERDNLLKTDCLLCVRVCVCSRAGLAAHMLHDRDTCTAVLYE